jgi:hypothetical protein
VKRIALTQGKEALVDDEDFERVACHKWSYRNRDGYASSHGPSLHLPCGKRRPATLLHRFITMAPPDALVDHRNRDRLDCRRQNLRLCNKSQNNANSAKRSRSSRFKGVHWDRDRGKWFAQIKVNNKAHALGRYADEEQAARAYDAAAIYHFGEFARTNFQHEASQCVSNG